MQDQNSSKQNLLNDSEADTREKVQSGSIDRSAYEMNSILDQNDPQNAAKEELKKLRDNEVRKRDTIWQRVFSPILPGSVRGSIFALACTALGVGSLALPKVVSFVGILLGTFMIICAGLITKFMIDVLVIAVERTNKFNYPAIVEVILGKKYKNILLAVLVCYLLGALVGYMVVIGDLGPKVLHAAFKIENNDVTRILVILIVWTIMLPFQFAKELNFLSRFSIIGIITLVYCVSLMIGEAYIFIGNNDYSNLPTEWYIKFDIHFPQAWALCAFAFICHSNVFPIQGELYKRSIKRMKKVTRRVSITLTILYTIIAVLGFICFFSDIPDIFINRKKPDEIENDYLMNIAKTLLIGTLMIGLPLNHFPCSFITITLVLNIIYLGLAIALPSILTVLSIIGGSFGVLHAMALPTLIYYKLSDKGFKDPKVLAMTIVGVTVSCLGFVYVFTQIIYGIMGKDL